MHASKSFKRKKSPAEIKAPLKNVFGKFSFSRREEISGGGL